LLRFHHIVEITDMLYSSGSQMIQDIAIVTVEC